MTPVPTAQLQNKQRSPESPLLTYSFPVQPWFRFFAQLGKSHLSRGRPGAAAKIMDGAASSGRPSIHPGCPRQVLSTRGWAHMFSGILCTPVETTGRVSPTWQASLTTLLCVLTDTTSVCTSPTFQNNSEKHLQLRRW